VRAYTPDSLKGDYLAQLFAFRGYAILQIAEDICPGFPINDVSADNQPVYSKPFTTDSAVTYAIAQIDSALANVHDSTNILQFASILKGRALLNLGQYEAAAAAVSLVPTEFAYTPYNGSGFFIVTRDWNNYDFRRFAVGDSEGVNGLPFVTSQDPRVGAVFQSVRFVDTTDSLYVQTKYPDFTTPMVIAGGIEARLIEAEAALNTHTGDWRQILNDLRTSIGLSDLDDPGSDSARVSMIYRERAFWLYLTGRRLGDLRRLIRNYGRDPETLFPKGAYPLRGGNYGTDTAIPFVQSTQQRYNPNITAGCTTR